MNELELAMSQINVRDKINQYDVPSGNGRNKLRTYRLFKHEFSTDPFIHGVNSILSTPIQIPLNSIWLIPI